MIANIDIDHDTVKIKINDPKLDGQNSIFELLIEKKIVAKNIDKIVIDFDNVTYINLR
jgi:anti-anti-sigma regulatory factor